ncbi:hypothetical protein [Hymenobacter aerophilus]|uniref:hypothetical protein n=1 Tax=Hymenobacter aerophilus TaxID=119644 RepID=UPI00037EAC04|nr:hypothetical protein [Hymenobacter aerophilus]
MKTAQSIFALLLVLSLSGTISWAQATGKSAKANSPYDASLLLPEPDPAIGNASFKPSAQVRGLKGEDGIVYWLSADQQSITAYKGQQTLWATNVASALPKSASGPSAIKSMAWCSTALFFSVGESGYVELDRQTGKINQAGTD